MQLLNLPNTFSRSDVTKNNSGPSTSFSIKSVKIFFSKRGGEHNTKTVSGFLSEYCTKYANQLRTYSERILFPLYQTFSICQIISSIRAESISMIGILKPKKRLKNFVFSGNNMIGMGGNQYLDIELNLL